MFYTTNESLPVPIPFEDLTPQEQKKHLENRRIFMNFLNQEILVNINEIEKKLNE